jgi:hypothetical protein
VFSSSNYRPSTTSVFSSFNYYFREIHTFCAGPGGDGISLATYAMFRQPPTLGDEDPKGEQRVAGASLFGV